MPEEYDKDKEKLIYQIVFQRATLNGLSGTDAALEVLKLLETDDDFLHYGCQYMTMALRDMKKFCSFFRELDQTQKTAIVNRFGAILKNAIVSHPQSLLDVLACGLLVEMAKNQDVAMRTIPSIARIYWFGNSSTMGNLFWAAFLKSEAFTISQELLEAIMEKLTSQFYFTAIGIEKLRICRIACDQSLNTPNWNAVMQYVEELVKSRMGDPECLYVFLMEFQEIRFDDLRKTAIRQIVKESISVKHSLSLLEEGMIKDEDMLRELAPYYERIIEVCKAQNDGSMQWFAEPFLKHMVPYVSPKTTSTVCEMYIDLQKGTNAGFMKDACKDVKEALESHGKNVSQYDFYTEYLIQTWCVQKARQDSVSMKCADSCLFDKIMDSANSESYGPQTKHYKRLIAALFHHKTSQNMAEDE